MAGGEFKLKNKLNLIMALSTLLTMILGCWGVEKSPEWTKAKMLADNLDRPAAITTDEENIYYVTGGTIASFKH